MTEDKRAFYAALVNRAVNAVRDRHTFFCEGIGDEGGTRDMEEAAIRDLWQLLAGEHCDNATFTELTRYPIPNLEARPCPSE